ncbi:MAG TPA: inosine-5-monophosphate dehydrogenase [Parvularcula sp.]|nr:inosine-5-monophosphate dehydrogenase [Parvularcula sp.]HBS30601.1 inosine-5-monophosphate dehydrogenase [Parvularcula sp.]HBS35370.1 inosine-5-monophosphate dehydrogenase [Parvularcula sp.]
MKVINILQSKGVDVFAVSPGMTLKEAVDVLGEKNIGAVIVKDGGGKVTGILSERDVVRRIRTDGPAVLTKTVAECMTPSPITCGPDALLDEILEKMTNRRIRHLPVVDSGRLIGVISIGDVVKRKIDNAEREAAALREYIAS